jgi:hypothetical protein
VGDPRQWWSGGRWIGLVGFEQMLLKQDILERFGESPLASKVVP